MYRGFAVAGSYAGAGDALAVNIINVVKDGEIRFVCGCARATRERSCNKKEAEAHTI